MKFVEKLEQAVQRNTSLLCIGLDAEKAKLPSSVAHSMEAQFEFNRRIIDATADIVCAYKPNMAFYEAEGSVGLSALRKTLEYIPKHIPIILDAKRGDIGNTSRMYARACFDDLKVDAVTVNAYMGSDAVEPFLQYKDKAAFVLVKTSNPSAVEFEDLEDRNGVKLYLHVANKVAEWNRKYPGTAGAVVGATYAEDLIAVRAAVGDAPLLIPGVGAQGGDVQSTIENGLNSRGAGVIINSSREILFASAGADFAEAARKKATELREAFNAARS